ncbi:MAG: hypothetical protein KG003_11705 [Bacteroidetes bacterium]|nr:hypothetical protein [Bacteroidota bacterium]
MKNKIYVAIIYLVCNFNFAFSQETPLEPKGHWSVAANFGVGRYLGWTESKGVYDRPLPYELGFSARYSEKGLPVLFDFHADLAHYYGYKGSQPNGYTFGTISCRFFDAMAGYNLMQNSKHFAAIFSAGIGFIVVESEKEYKIQSTPDPKYVTETYEGRHFQVPLQLSVERNIVGNLQLGIYGSYRIVAATVWMENNNSSSSFLNGGMYLRWNIKR